MGQNDDHIGQEDVGPSGDIYEQAVVKRVAGFSRGNPTHLFGVTRFGAPVVYVRAGSIHHTAVAGYPHLRASFRSLAARLSSPRMR
jgi:hypothetical protein